MLSLSVQKTIIGFANYIVFLWHVFQSSLPNFFFSKCDSQVHWLKWILCVSYLVIWGDDSNDNDENRRKRWHCVISWLSNHKCVWTTTAIFVKNLQSFLSISVIWHAMLSFMGIQKQFPKVKKMIKLIMEAMYVMLM